jgi:hypothetical protein
VLIGRKRLLFPNNIPRSSDWKRGVEQYDMTNAFPVKPDEIVKQA